MVGLGLVALFEYRDSTFSDEEDVVHALSLPVLGTIPVMMAGEQHLRSRRVAVAVGLVAILLGLAAFILSKVDG